MLAKYKTHCKNGHEFTTENTYIKASDGRRNCKTCLANNLKKYRTRNRDYYREHSRKYKINTRYNLSNEEHEAMMKNQSFKCANPLCDVTFQDNTPHIDHDHACCDSAFSCGRCVRGILCNRCNRVLGLVNDNTLIMQGLMEYLESWKKFTEQKMERESL